MHTKIKTTVYAAKLRKKLAELKKKRVADLATYKTAVADWKYLLKTWITDHSKTRVDKIGLNEIRTSSNWNRAPRFDANAFFAGAPEPPVYPSDEQIRAITNLLRHLGITRQATVYVSTEDVAKYLGDEQID